MTAARLAAERRTDHDVEVLRSVLATRAQARSSGDDAATAAADLALHRAVIAASGNSVYGDVYDSLVPTLEAAIAANVQEIDDKYDDEHEDMVDAIIERDPERASRSARCLLNELLRMRS